MIQSRFLFTNLLIHLGIYMHEDIYVIRLFRSLQNVKYDKPVAG